MPLPSSSIVLAGESSRELKPAYLIKFPEDVWGGIQKAAKDGGKVSLSLDGIMTLHIPDYPPLPLESLPSSSTSEIHLLSASPDPSLIPHAVASTKLSIPLSSASSARVADKLRTQTDAIDQERKERANRVNGVGKSRAAQSVAALMGRSDTTSSAAYGVGAGVPMIPLKTRVVQLLALGPTNTDNIVARVGAGEQDVMRVVHVVGRQIQLDTWTLQPAQYSKVKIGSWKYTYVEKMRVVRLAREAFDELGLPSDADERVDLDKKEAEAMSGASSSSNEEKVPSIALKPLPAPSKTVLSPPIPASTRRKTPQTLIGKQMAKFNKEKRASSMPNVKKDETLHLPDSVVKHKSASPPENDLHEVVDFKGKAVKESDRSKDRMAGGVGKRIEENGKQKRSQVRTGSANDSGAKRKRTPSYSSSSSEDEPLRGRSTVPVKPPPRPRSPGPELKLNSHAHPLERDPETMRDRYEELFPAYALLTRKLAKVHRAAEKDGNVALGAGQVEHMVKKWQKWHAELAGIRIWFGDGEPS